MKVHAAVVKSTIETIPSLATKTYLAVAPRDANGKLPTPPYVVIFPTDGEDTAERITGPAREYHPSFTFHIVGSSYDNAQTETELIKAKFITAGLGNQLSVSGELTERCVWSVPVPIQVDNSLTPPLVYNIAELGFASTPSS